MGAPKIKREKEVMASALGFVLEGIQVEFLIENRRHESLLFCDVETLMNWLDDKEQEFEHEGNCDLVSHCQDFRSDIARVLLGEPKVDRTLH